MKETSECLSGMLSDILFEYTDYSEDDGLGISVSFYSFLLIRFLRLTMTLSLSHAYAIYCALSSSSF